MPNLSRTKVLVFIIVVLLLTNIGMLIFFTGMKSPQKKNGDRNRGPNSINLVLVNKVGFTPDQMKKLEDMRHQQWDTMRILFEDIRQAKIAFYHHINDPSLEENLLRESAATIGNKQEAIDLQAFRNFRAVRALCTPKQLPKYDSLMPAAIQNMWFPARRGNNRNKDSASNKSSHN